MTMAQHPLNKKSRSCQLRAIRKDPLLIAHISSPDKDLQFEALCRNATTYNMIDDIDPSALLRAVKQNPILLNLVPAQQREAFQLAAVLVNISALHHVQDPSLELQLAAVTKFGQAIQHIKNPSVVVQRTVLLSEVGYSVLKALPDSFDFEAIDAQYPGFSTRFTLVIALGVTGADFARLLRAGDLPGANLMLPDLAPTF